MNNYYLYLIWKDPQTRRNYTVGKLEKSCNLYSFEYGEEVERAEEAGWKLLEAFPQKTKYESDTVFPAFSSRLPDRKRRDISKILQKYGLDEYDEFELLRKSGARLPIDTYELIDPIFPGDSPVEREFYVMGIRHHAPCDGKDCELFPPVNVGDTLLFHPEPENEHDSNAICVQTNQGEHLGYVPRYYSKAILERLNNGVSYTCTVIEINKEENCAECVKVKLNMPEIE